MKKTLYEVLGVRRDASVEEIKAAYERLIGGPAAAADPNLRIMARDALELLSDPVRRASYDTRLAAQASPRPAMPVAQTQADEPSGVRALVAEPWVKWVAGGLLLALVLGWWATRKPKEPSQRAPAPAVREVGPRTVYIVQDPQTGPAPREAAPASAPAAPTPAATPAPRSGAEVFEQVSASVALVAARGSSASSIGSGVVIDHEKVITNCHVIAGASDIQVKVGRQTYTAVAGIADEQFDLCRLHVAGLPAPAVQVGSVSSLRPGQKVFAVGAPQGLELTLSDGIVSALRPVEGGSIVQITAPISPGSSGGGLFDESATLVGVTTFGHRYGQNLNFAVPADWIAEMKPRRTGAAGSGILPTGQKSSAPDKLILGTWLCRGSQTGLNGEFTFREDGVAIVPSSAGRVASRWRLQGRLLYVGGRNDNGLELESIEPDKMVLNAGQGYRVVCER